ncbi:glycosyltransferase family 4 protein [Marinitoga sp. 38H-ov]|uniref:glycosyltransferase family 4 protein n=1 Tax=Marinitoga sp. 38H-ov TaxID=1755814 RepID=UPI0013EC8213|nr:glycosyltransferase family 4 protein [Marinitoga sp. 38H-ov]KAF2955573.1 hypothetical protein AS160_09380 [Marinitoga sp. 38H-ov]
MKIALVSSDNSKVFQSGGKHIHQNLLEKGFKELNYNINVYYPPVNYNILSLFFLSLKNFNKIFDTSLPVMKKKLFLEHKLNYFRNLKLSNYNIVHAHDVLSAYGVNHSNIILTLHGYFAKEGLNYNDFSEKEKNKIYNYYYNIEKKALKNVKQIIAVDTRIKEYLINEFKFPEEKIEVIYNFIDTDKFKVIDDIEKNKLREELNIPKKSFIVLVPRRYVDKNGVIYAARAFKNMNDNFYFIFIGRGPLKERVSDILKNNKNARVLDNVDHDNIVKYYQVSDVVLIPSITTNEGIEEATSLSMLEGMACEKYVVCSNIGGMKEVIRDGVNGFLINQKSEKEIIKIINYIYQNSEKLSYIRSNAREYVVENHGYIQYINKLIKIYEKLLNRK